MSSTSSRPARGHRLPRGGNTCDFCGVSEVGSIYTCRAFEWEGFPIFREERGRWAACFTCSGLVDDGEWGQLTRRVMQEVRKRRGTTEGELTRLRDSLRRLHNLFAEHMVKGAALTVTRPLVRRITSIG